MSGAPEGWRAETAASMVRTRRQGAARIAAGMNKHNGKRGDIGQNK